MARRSRTSSESQLMSGADILVKSLVDLLWGQQSLKGVVTFCRTLFQNDIIAKVDTLITDVDCWPGNQPFDLLLRLAAKRAP